MSEEDNRNFHKNNLKKELKRLNTKELQKRLRELEADKMKLETTMFRMHGSSTVVRNYPKEAQTKPMRNLSLLKQDIGRVKTFLNLKLLRGE